MLSGMPDELSAAIAHDLGITDLPHEEQKTLIGTFGEIALKAATLSVIGKLTEEKREAFLKLAEAGNPTALKEFLDQEVPGHEEMVRTAVTKEVQNFKDFYIENAGKKSAS